MRYDGCLARTGLRISKGANPYGGAGRSRHQWTPLRRDGLGWPQLSLPVTFAWSSVLVEGGSEARLTDGAGMDVCCAGTEAATFRLPRMPRRPNPEFPHSAVQCGCSLSAYPYPYFCALLEPPPKTQPRWNRRSVIPIRAGPFREPPKGRRCRPSTI